MTPVWFVLPAELTPRQRQVVLGLVAGASVRQLARDLGVAPSTVRAHVESIRRRLAVRPGERTRVALVRRCVVRGAT